MASPPGWFVVVCILISFIQVGVNRKHPMPQIPSYPDVVQAAKRLRGHVRETPLIRSDVIDILTEKTVWFKPECNQKVGAFKYRGAFNRLSAMNEAERARGVVAYSSGNHAQGVSRAAKELGISAVIVMPTDAPMVKTDGVNRDGAKIVSYDRHTESREAIAAQISKDEGRIVVPSYDDPYIIAGQGTVGLEIAQESNKLGIAFDALITPIGGGGLCAGTSLAMNVLSHTTKIYGAEPEHYNDHQLSIRAGKRLPYPEAPETLCDALMTPIPGELTFPINIKSVSDVFTATDRDCLMAMAISKKELGVQLEPGGAVAMAAVLNGVFTDTAHNIICVILSGGNADTETIARADASFA